MKIGDFNTAEELMLQLSNLGIKPTKLDKAISASRLPKKGKFVSFEVVGDVNFNDGTIQEIYNKSKTEKLTKAEQTKLSEGETTSDFRHIQLKTDNGDTISLSRLQISGYRKLDNDNKMVAPNLSDPENDANSDLVESANNGFYLRSNYPMNGFLQGNQAVALQKIMGKSFTAEPIELIQSIYIDGGYDNFDDVKTKNITSYEITVK